MLNKNCREMPVYSAYEGQNHKINFKKQTAVCRGSDPLLLWSQMDLPHDKLQHLYQLAQAITGDKLSLSDFKKDLSLLEAEFQMRRTRFITVLTEEVPMILGDFVLMAECLGRSQDELKLFLNKSYPWHAYDESPYNFISKQSGVNPGTFYRKICQSFKSIRHFFGAILEEDHSSDLIAYLRKGVDFYLKLSQKIPLARHDFNPKLFLSELAPSSTKSTLELLTTVSISHGKKVRTVASDRRGSYLKTPLTTPFESAFLTIAARFYSIGQDSIIKRGRFDNAEDFHYLFSYPLGFGSYLAAKRLFELDMFSEISKEHEVRIFPSFEQYLYVQARILQGDLILDVCDKCGCTHLIHHEGRKHLGLSFDCPLCVIRGDKILNPHRTKYMVSKDPQSLRGQGRRVKTSQDSFNIPMASSEFQNASVFQAASTMSVLFKENLTKNGFRVFPIPDPQTPK